MPGTDSKNILLNIFSSSSDGIACVDTNGNFLFVNKSFENLLGYPNSEVKAKNIYQVLVNANGFNKLLSQDIDNDFCKKDFVRKSGEVSSFQTKIWRQQNGLNELNIWILIKEVTGQEETKSKKNNFSNPDLVLELMEVLKEHYKVIHCLKNLQQDLGGEINDKDDYISYSLKYCTKIQDLLIKLVTSGNNKMLHKSGVIDFDQIDILKYLN